MKSYKLLLKLLISIIFLSFVLSRVDWFEFKQTMSNVGIFPILLTFILTIVGIVISSMRLQVIFGSGTLRDYVSLNFVGIMFNTLLPGITGGDLYRVSKLKRIGGTLSQSAGIILLDRLFGLAGLVFWFFTGLVLLFINHDLSVLASLNTLEYKLNGPLTLSICIALVVAAFVLRSRVMLLFSRLQLFIKNDILTKLHEPKVTLKALVLSVVFQFLSPLMLFILLKAFEPNLGTNLAYIMTILPIITIITMLPVSFQGIGLKEFLYITLLPAVQSEIIISASFVSYIIYTICAFIGAAIYFYEK